MIASQSSNAWGSLMNSVDDGFEYCNALGRQAHASSDYNTMRKNGISCAIRGAGYSQKKSEHQRSNQ